MQYDIIKNWCKEHSKEIIVGACFVLIFLVGFGTGRYDKEAVSRSRRSQAPSNYTKTQANQQKPEIPAVDGAKVNAKEQVAGETIKTTGAGEKDSKSDCIIKGNISSTGGKIYHMKGGAFYDRTNPEQCFKTEEEAKAAGYRKSSR